MTKAERTRQRILDIAFDMIYRNGYQATSADKIIEQTNLTKGAFYYHFKNKEEIGLAVIREIIRPRLVQSLLRPISGSQDPMDIYRSIEHKLLNDSDYQVEFGCPTNNLVQEMSPLSPRFNQALRSVLDQWIGEVERVLVRATGLGAHQERSGLRECGSVYR